MDYKTCTKCHERKEATHFSRDTSKKDGLYSSCKDCVRKQRGMMKMEHKVIGALDGYSVVAGSPYPYVLSDRGRERAHRYVARKKYGRELLPNEHVHHIDGNKNNYSPNNIIILSKNTHHRHHAKAHWEGNRKGVDVVCNGCGSTRYYPKSYVDSKYGGDAKRMLEQYRCKNCYIPALRKVTKE